MGDMQLVVCNLLARSLVHDILHECLQKQQAKDDDWDDWNSSDYSVDFPNFDKPVRNHFNQSEISLTGFQPNQDDLVLIMSV
jgi:hypothetical protein